MKSKANEVYNESWWGYSHQSEYGGIYYNENTNQK